MNYEMTGEDSKPDANGWFPTDVLPNSTGDVLAYRDGHIFMCEYDNGFWFWSNGRGLPSHWRPLPAPPVQP